MTEKQNPSKDDPDSPPVDGPGHGDEGESESGTGDTSQDKPGGGSGTDGKQSPE
jgi:hypothetical protein